MPRGQNPNSLVNLKNGRHFESDDDSTMKAGKYPVVKQHWNRGRAISRGCLQAAHGNGHKAAERYRHARVLRRGRRAAEAVPIADTRT